MSTDEIYFTLYFFTMIKYRCQKRCIKDRLYWKGFKYQARLANNDASAMLNSSVFTVAVVVVEVESSVAVVESSVVVVVKVLAVVLVLMMNVRDLGLVNHL